MEENGDEKKARILNGSRAHSSSPEGQPSNLAPVFGSIFTESGSGSGYFAES